MLISEEVAPQTYRKVALNGWLVQDPEPVDRPQVDQELEQTCIDALTLQLRHQTTEVYMPLPRQEFALNVARNNIGAVWLNGCGLAPAQRPDLPFGNCWTSGVAANIHLIERGKSLPVDVLATDDQGTTHRFVALYDTERCIGYYPLPSAWNEQEAAAMSLSRDAKANWIFRRKYGTTLIYSSREIFRKVGDCEWHRFYPMVSAGDSTGIQIQHLFHGGNAGLIPDEIVFKSLSVQIERDAAGCVTRIVDPRGSDFLYHYRASAFPGGAPLLVALDRPPTGGIRGRVSYDYEEVAEEEQSSGPPAAYHTNLNSITDRNGNTHRFEYMMDRSRIHSTGGLERPAVGMTRCITRTYLPRNIGSASFHNYSLLYADPGRKSRRITVVNDAVGNSRVYKFTDPQIISLSGLPVLREGAANTRKRSPRLAVFRGLTISYCRGNRHRLVCTREGDDVAPAWPSKQIAQESYDFEVEAGMALSAATDASGNVTRFLHEDQRLAKPGEWLNPTSLRHSDPTARINAMGATRRYRYDPVTRLLVQREDELGRITQYSRDPVHGALIAEATYETRAAFERREPFALTEFEHGDVRFPAIATRKIVRKLPRPEPSPDWEQDLVTDYELNDLARMVCEIRDPDLRRRCTRFIHDGCGNKLSHQYPNGFFVQFRYDSLNQLIRIYHPRENPIRIDFDLCGNKVRQVESNGEVTVHEYDALNRRKRSFTGNNDEFGLKRTAPLEFDPLGFVTFNPSIEGESRKFIRDAMQRMVKAIYGRGAVVRFAYGANFGSLLFKSSEFDSTKAHRRGRRPSRWKYDACCRKIEESIFGRAAAFFEYDAVGNLITEVDSNGRITRHEYDALNRRVKTVPPNAVTQVTLYSSTGLEYRTIDASGSITEKRYDGAGEPSDPQS